MAGKITGERGRGGSGCYRGQWADPARAVLLTLAGWTEPGTGFWCARGYRSFRRRFCVRRRSVLRRPLRHPARRRLKSHAALRVVTPPLEARRRRPEPTQTIVALDHRGRGARGRQDRAVAIVQGVAKKNFRWRRPRHATAEGSSDCRRNRACGTRPPVWERLKPRPATSFSFTVTQSCC